MKTGVGKSKRKKNRGATTDDQFRYATAIDPNLETWRDYAEKWVGTRHEGKGHAMDALRIFLVDYLHGQKLTTDPTEFLRLGYNAPCLYETCLSHLKRKRHIISRFTTISAFIESVLKAHCAEELHPGIRIVSAGFRNPIPALPAAVDGHAGEHQESNKSVLPYRFIRQLQDLVCPKTADNFKDWKLMQDLGDTFSGGSWFEVPFECIDDADPNCVWRERPLREKERSLYRPYLKGKRKRTGSDPTIWEMWCPVRAMGMYLKLQLPLRTYQVRMLDSGEADSHRYAQKTQDEPGEWVHNTGPLAQDTAPNKGVFRQMTDDLQHRSMTGLFINTNKTADRGKEEWAKGYEIPWDRPDVLYWLVRLRDWQEKYNPINAPMPWTELTTKHVGKMKSTSILKSMGSTCFLLRDAGIRGDGLSLSEAQKNGWVKGWEKIRAWKEFCITHDADKMDEFCRKRILGLLTAAQGEERCKPITDSSLAQLWYKLLVVLEQQCAADKEFDAAGSPLRFVITQTESYESGTAKNTTTYYPLHALRVSLITAFALEGGVPMAILSKCIAGHARLIMTLYYTKVGITYCTETMDRATKRLMETEQDNYARWLKDKTYAQLEANGAYCDPAAIQALMQAMENGASLVKTDMGFCPKGHFGCDSGGVYVNGEAGSVTYGAVPGYPEKNCPRCRWFFTGPAFMDGLQNHFNWIGYCMGDVAERIVTLEKQITALEDERHECREKDRPFLKQGTLEALRKTLQAEYEKNNKYGEDYNATLRLIARCKLIVDRPQKRDGVQLVAVGGLQDMRIAFKDLEENGQMHHLLAVLAGSTVYPEHDVRKAVLQGQKALDLMLRKNGKPPVLLMLTEEDLSKVVPHIITVLATKAGSIENAVSFVEGTRQLAELGVDLDIEQLTRDMATGTVLEIAPVPCRNILGSVLLSPSSNPPKESAEEIENDAA